MLNNIFSKENPIRNTNNQIKIIVDNREKNSLVPAELIGKNFKIEFKQLKVADYIVKETAIERKTESDFNQSIGNKRIWKQLEEIKQYKNYLLIIEKENSTPNNSQTKGAILSIALKYKIPILFSNHPKETAKYIELIANKQTKETSLNPNKKTLTKLERSQFILEAFEGIGPKTAKELLNRFTSLKEIFTATNTELEDILKNKTKKFLNQLL